MKTKQSKVSAVNRQIFNSNKLIHLISFFLLLLTCNLANAKTTTFKPDNNLISENLSSPALIMD